MKILILTEASQKKGLGHVIRCMSVYNEAVANSIDVTLIVNSDSCIKSFINVQNGVVQNWLLNESVFRNIIKNYDCVVIDSYDISDSFCNILSETCKIPVFIDYIQKRVYFRGIVVDASVEPLKYNYSQNKKVKYLKGFDFVLLRDEFKPINRRVIKENITDILISLGGTDVRNLTPFIIDILKSEGVNLKIMCNENFKNVIDFNDYKNIQLIYNPTPKIIKKNMLESDIAISSAGQTLNELAVCQTPTIMIGVADNQHWNINLFKRQGFLFAGWWNDETLKNNIISCYNYYKAQKNRAIVINSIKSMIDGFGAARLIKEILTWSDSEKY
ncbi:MAG: hypothetical protein M0Q02_12300 [Candidatus Muirbacterium halophilum]|nr:hypothetical protein [Candidatus Muirbacterium halophilum]